MATGSPIALGDVRRWGAVAHGLAWLCTCEPPNTNKTFLIDGAAGLDACAVGAALCAGLGPEVAIDVPSCELTRDEQGTERLSGPSCTIQLSCSTPPDPLRGL